ncbi:transcriptional regulator [Enterococcus durans IPLA 655]|uniref:MerR family transcriptional regulator n=1 Tax=Enterococcus durans TaxID=53345 RepID=UPI000328414C|nr:MerR family transcriptional regulator [Enterococcus durans]EMS74315.1 transcriptional regulator [Enterococcus durans IPLA 655]
MQIGELSNKTNVSIRSLRYYEEKELIIPNRLANGYREYDDTMLEQVKTIKLYFDLGLITEEIKSIIDCDPFVFPYKNLVCDDVVQLYEKKPKEVNNQLASLEKVQDKLQKRLLRVKELRKEIHEEK